MVVERQLAKEGRRRKTWAARSSRSACGSGRRRAAARSSPQLRLMGFSLDWSRERFTLDARPVPRGARGVRLALRAGPHLPRRLHRQLVPALRDRALRPRGGDARRARAASGTSAIRSKGGRRRDRGRDHAPGDDAGRHRRSPCTPRTSATGTWSAQDRDPAAARAGDPDRRRRVRGPRVRHRRGEGHARPRPQRLRGRQSDSACRPSTSWTSGRVLERERRALRRPGSLRGPRKASWSSSQAEGLLGQDRAAPRPALGRCQRCNTVVEPRLSRQWFVKTKPLAEPAIEAVEDGPDRLRARELEQDLLRVDAQHPRLVHQPPALVGAPHPGLVLRPAAASVIVAREDPTACPKCGRRPCAQENDVLDTWFSSALWPFSHPGLARADARTSRPTTRTT